MLCPSFSVIRSRSTAVASSDEHEEIVSAASEARNMLLSTS